MKRIFIIISLLSLACAAKAENDFYTEFKQEVTEALKYVDKEQFTTGLLSDYGFSWVDLKDFGQIYDDSVWVNYDCWKAIYGGLYDSRVNSNVDMPELETVISSLEKNKSVGILYYKYDCFREDALEEGLITNDDGYIRIVDGKPSPFEQWECFAVSPPINRQDGLTLSLLFKKDTYYTNTDKTIVGIEVDFDGTGYKTTEWDEPIAHTYTSEGAKEIKFRILMTADTRVMTYESKCVVSVKQKPSGPSRTQTQLSISHKDIPSDGSHAGGVMEIVYAANGALGGETFIRPLIIVGDMDLSALSPDLKMTLEKLLGTGGISPSLTQLNKMFDIIYINYNNGLDDLIRNGEMVRQAIKEIQANPSSLGCDQSYVIGLGMGGVVARIALNKMEMAGENHNVRKLIAVNSPFQGINVPIGLQFSIQHLSEFIRRIEVKMSETIEGFANIQKIANLLDQPAFRQLLIHRINKSFEYDNSEHDNFMLYKIFLAKPKNCASVAIATGYMRDNYGDRLFQPYSEIFTLHDFEKHYSSGELPNLPLCIGRGSVDIDIDAKSIPENEVKTIYSGELKFRKKVLVLNTPKRVTLRNSFNSTTDMNPIDGTNGCYIPMDLISGKDEFISSLLKVDKFCFLPTYSALDIADEDTYFKGSGIDIPFDRYYLDSGSKSYPDNSYMIDYLMKEIMPTVTGETENILDDTELSLDNVPNMSGIAYNWSFKNGNFKVVSGNGTSKVTVRPLVYSGKAHTVTDSVTVSVSALGQKITVPEKRISAERVYIDGSDYLSKDEIYRLTDLPSAAGTVEWSVSDSIRINPINDMSVSLRAEGYLDKPWVEAAFSVGDTDYRIRKDLETTRLDSISFQMAEQWWDPDILRDKYYFMIQTHPYIPVDRLHFCWSNDVEVSNKFGDDDQEEIIVTPVEPGGGNAVYPAHGGGAATIETEGDISPCLNHTIGDPIPFDSISVIIKPGIHDHIDISPTAYEPGGDPIPWDPIEPEPFLVPGPNAAIFTMPQVDDDEIASGLAYCDVSDDYGRKIRIGYFMQSEWNAVCGTYSVSPNPAGERLEVKMTVEGDPAAVTAGAPVTALLYSGTGLAAKETFADIRNGGSLDVSRLPEGTYYLNIEVNGTVVDRQVVLIQR